MVTNRLMSVLILIFGVISITTIALAESGPKGASAPETIKLSLIVARQVALKIHPGFITDQVLQKKSGGSGSRYTFKIISRGKPYEVGIDANTGAALENIEENSRK